jgi:hypothetical protein
MAKLVDLLSRLEGVKQIGPSQWKACCPAHDDKHPSFYIKEDDGKVLLSCKAGCFVGSILAAVGMDMQDLFPERPVYRYRNGEGKRLIEEHGGEAGPYGKSLKLSKAQLFDKMGYEAMLVAMFFDRIDHGLEVDKEDLRRVRLSVQIIKRLGEEVAYGY